MNIENISILVILPANGWNSFYESLEAIDRKLEKAGLVIFESKVVQEDNDASIS